MDGVKLSSLSLAKSIWVDKAQTIELTFVDEDAYDITLLDNGAVYCVFKNRPTEPRREFIVSPGNWTVALPEALTEPAKAK